VAGAGLPFPNTNANAWTHPTLKRLIAESRSVDPIIQIERRARELALAGMERGWRGPSFDPVQLAERLDVAVCYRDDIPQTRLFSLGQGRFRLECNPAGDPVTVRLGTARALSRLLLREQTQWTREGDGGSDERVDDWQLEALWNAAAAELLMPAGALPAAEAQILDLTYLLDLQGRLVVSTETLLRRVIKLTDQPAALLACTRSGDPDAGFHLDYMRGSRAWSPQVSAGAQLSGCGVLGACDQIGTPVHAVEAFSGFDEPLRVQAVAIAPYPGHRFPRVLALLQPTQQRPVRFGLAYLRGHAAPRQAEGKAILAQVTDCNENRWQGPGLVSAMEVRYAAARQHEYVDSQPRLMLGDVHLTTLSPDLCVASLIAHDNQGDCASHAGTLRVGALRQALERLSTVACEQKACVHMPLMTSSQDRTLWGVVRDLVTEELLGRGVPVKVYVAPDHQSPVGEATQLTLGL
jgi:hypothetical protein